MVHDLRPGEGLGEEDHVGIGGADARDQPLPEGEGLGVRVVDAEDAHALARPEANDVAQRQPESRHRVLGVEVDVDDVFVGLGRVLREFDRAVGPPVEPAGMLLQPGMIGRALHREIERDLKTMSMGGGN